MWLMFIMKLFQTEAHPAKILEMSAIEAALSDQMMKPSVSLSFQAGHHGAPSSLSKRTSTFLQRQAEKLSPTFTGVFIFLMSFAGFFFFLLHQWRKASFGLSGSVFIKHPRGRKSVLTGLKVSD